MDSIHIYTCPLASAKRKHEHMWWQGMGAWAWDIYFLNSVPTRIPLSLSFFLWLWKIVLSLWTFKSTELRVVLVMAHRYFEPQCTSLSPGQPFVNSVFIKPHFKSPNLRGYIFSVSTLTSSLESNSFSCSPCRHILMELILFILTELCLWSDLPYFPIS